MKKLTVLVSVLSILAISANAGKVEPKDAPKFTKDNKRGMSKNYVMPSPADMALAIDRLGIKDVSKYIDTKTKSSYPSSANYAIAMGVLSADVFYYANAGKNTKVHSTFSKVLSISKKLNLAGDIRRDMFAMKSLIGQKDWKAFTRKMDASRANIEKKYKENYRDDLAILSTAAAWAEGLTVASAAVNENYEKSRTHIFHQPTLAFYLLGTLQANKAVSDLPAAKEMIASLGTLVEIMNKSDNRLYTKAQVKEIASVMSSLKQKILN